MFSSQAAAILSLFVTVFGGTEGLSCHLISGEHSGNVASPEFCSTFYQKLPFCWTACRLGSVLCSFDTSPHVLFMERHVYMEALVQFLRPFPVGITSGFSWNTLNGLRAFFGP